MSVREERISTPIMPSFGYSEVDAALKEQAREIDKERAAAAKKSATALRAMGLVIP